MAYRIELSPRAEADVDEIVAYISQDSPEVAKRWVTRLYEKLDGLDTFPRGCSLANEDEDCLFELRQAVFGNYRILFTIRDDDNLVWVLTIRHAARRFISPDELESIE